MGKRRIRIILANMPRSYEDIIPGRSVAYRVPIECVYSKKKK